MGDIVEHDPDEVEGIAKALYQADDVHNDWPLWRDVCDSVADKYGARAEAVLSCQVILSLRQQVEALKSLAQGEVSSESVPPGSRELPRHIMHADAPRERSAIATAPDSAPRDGNDPSIMNRLLRAIADSYPDDENVGVNLSRRDAMDAAKRITDLLIRLSDFATALYDAHPEHPLVAPIASEASSDSRSEPSSVGVTSESRPKS